MKKIDMINAILEKKPDYDLKELKKMKVDEINNIYNELFPKEDLTDIDPVELKHYNMLKHTGDEDDPCCKACIRSMIVDKTFNKMFDKWNSYFFEIENYQIDEEVEQAFPRDCNWFNFSPDNICLYGLTQKPKFDSIKEEVKRTELLIKYDWMSS
jgi:hypothetical protein